MRAPVTVITASIPGRSHLLARCVDSVYAQTVAPSGAHLVLAEPPQEGIVSVVHCASQQNRLLPAVTTEWTMRLADDDQLFPHHLETFLPKLYDNGLDVIYSWDASGTRPRHDCSRENLVSYFYENNCIDGSAVAVRTSLLRQVGGWPEEYENGMFVDCGIARFEDWALWYRLAVAGARFCCIPEVTWLYGLDPVPHISYGDGLDV